MAQAPPAAPAVGATAKAAPAKQPLRPGEQRDLLFNFKDAEWEDVLEWFAEKADKSLQFDDSPPGTFSFQDRDPYTPSEALDRINSVLLRKGFTLVEHGRMLFVPVDGTLTLQPRQGVVLLVEPPSDGIVDVCAQGGPYAVDLDGDAWIGVGDLTRLLSSWGACDGLCPADLDGDGLVGLGDLTVLLGHWGPCT